jgi:hypothetical protein
MKLLFRAALISVLMTGAVWAQESLVGRWQGTADTTFVDGTPHPQPTVFEIKMADGELAALWGGRNPRTPATINVLDDKVDVYVLLPGDGDEHLHWQLTLTDGKLEGQFICIHDGPAKWRYDRRGPITMTKQAAQ